MRHVEMIRTVVAKDAVVKVCSAAMNDQGDADHLPCRAAEALEPFPDMALLCRCAALRPGELTR